MKRDAHKRKITVRKRISMRERWRERERDENMKTVSVPGHIAPSCTPTPSSDNRLCFTGKDPSGKRQAGRQAGTFSLSLHYGNTQNGTGYIAFHAP